MDVTQTMEIDYDETSEELSLTREERGPQLLSDYILLGELGRGAQGIVYKALRKQDRKIIALKVLYVRIGTRKYNNTLREIRALEEISNPRCSHYLTCYYGHSYDPQVKALLIEMEYIIGDTLDKYAKRLYERGEYKKLYRHLVAIAKDISKGLEIAHTRGIIHNDVKPSNIIIDTDMIPTLVDFGVACKTVENKCRGRVNSRLEMVDCCGSFHGTPYYMPPESVDNIRYNSSDIWSLGITLYHSATGGKLPFDYPKRNVMTILQTNAKQSPKKLHTGNEKLDHIINNSLINNPFNRITPLEIYSIGN